MSTRTYTRKFDDKKKLASMLALREQGWSYLSLAFIFGVDFSSIYYECKKYGVDKTTNQITFITPLPLDPINLTDILASVIAVKKVPMCYADYLAIEKSR